MYAVTRTPATGALPAVVAEPLTRRAIAVTVQRPRETPSENAPDASVVARTAKNVSEVATTSTPAAAVTPSERLTVPATVASTSGGRPLSALAGCAGAPSTYWLKCGS